jgi:hypothetical protein
LTAALSLAELQALRREIDAALNSLYREYADAHHIAWESQVIETAHVQAGHSNVPHGQLLAHTKLRGQLGRTSGMLRRVATQLTDHRSYLLAAIEGDEKRHGDTFDAVKSAGTATIEDVEDAAEAQDRRRSTGEALTGNDPEVRDRLGERPLADVLGSARRGNRR